MDDLNHTFQSGMVAIVGPPNAGKSTLMNHLLGQKISIVTPKPQTTRNRILGVVNGENYQIVLLDTPGLHKTDHMLNQEMVRIALESLVEVDLVLFLIDVSLNAPKKVHEKNNKEITGYMNQVTGPSLLILNKIDLMDRKKLLPLIQSYSALHPFQAILPISALNGDGTTTLIEEILKILPSGPRYFPEDIPTDATERFLVTEIIREKVFLLTGQEVPYATAVQIDSFKEDSNKKLITIHASIVVERSSQKGIVIGKGGHKLKSIGTAARVDIEKMVGYKVLLKLWVKVKKKWSQDEHFLRELGFK